jgi:hypothetical protein
LTFFIKKHRIILVIFTGEYEAINTKQIWSESNF